MTYADINSAFPSNKIYNGDYRKFLINHGQHPQNAAYAYVILPEATQERLKNYTQDNALKILANTESIQAVKMETAGYLGINFWAATGGSIADITTDKPISLLNKLSRHKPHTQLQTQLKPMRPLISNCQKISRTSFR